MEHVRDLIPARGRIWIYAVYAGAGLVVGSVTVATGGTEWTAAAERVLAYLGMPLAVLAGVNVPAASDARRAAPDDYFAREQAQRELGEGGEG